MLEYQELKNVILVKTEKVCEVFALSSGFKLLEKYQSTERNRM